MNGWLRKLAPRSRQNVALVALTNMLWKTDDETIIITTEMSPNCRCGRCEDYVVSDSDGNELFRSATDTFAESLEDTP